ncbi:MAG: addiction module protein [Gammaproteobacteria bacterium]
MTRAIVDIERDIQELSARQRAELLRSLIADLDAPAEVDVEEAWLKESERRLTEIENGTAETIPGREVLEEARSRLK